LFRPGISGDVIKRENIWKKGRKKVDVKEKRKNDKYNKYK
jgi:hypothetical protein